MISAFKKNIDIIFIRVSDSYRVNNSLWLLIVASIMFLIELLDYLLYGESSLRKMNLVIPVFFVMGAIGSILQYKGETERKQKQLDDLKSYTVEIETLYSDMRDFRHDYINILSTMAEYLKGNEYDKLKKYFNEKIVPLSNQMDANNCKINQLKNINTQEIKSIVAIKSIIAQEKGIDFSVEVISPIVTFNMDIIDLSRIIGIVLDNAIEASVLCEVPYIHMAFIENKTTVTIVIANSCTDTTPPVHQIYRKGFSTKGKGRGIGLANLKRTIEKYPNTILETVISDNRFVITITI